MKLSELTKAFEEYKADSEAQHKQLREEVHQLQRELSVKSNNLMSERRHNTKVADIEFGETVMELLKKNSNHPFIKDRDVFTTWQMHIVITSMMKPEDSGLTKDLDEMLGCSSSPRTRNELRMMCKRLVNSGLFITRKAQRYLPSMPEYDQKPSRRRRTAIIVGNFDKYKDLSESAMDKELERQTKIANARHSVMIKEQVAREAKAETTELDTGVSFL